MSVHKVDVYLDSRKVGSLAETAGHQAAFAYDEEWLLTGFPVSPFSLPLEKKVFVPSAQKFHGLFGVFADSLPDAWGRLLVDRMLLASHRTPESVSELERLMIVGNSGMGALSYRPAADTAKQIQPTDLDALCEKCAAILRHEDVRNPDEIYFLGGNSGGALPKIMTDEWIIKFPASREMAESGRMEKEYMDCASACGISVPETKLMPSARCSGYFAVRRFDRERTASGLVRRHVLTAAALLETDWRSGTADYHTLMKLTGILSRSNQDDLLQMYRRMCFNVFGHNRDDHLKNFSWIYDPALDCWHPSPAYDLTWSNTWYGEHTLTVNGNSRNPGMEELTAVGKAAGLTPALCRRIASEIRDRVSPLEEKYRNMQS